MSALSPNEPTPSSNFADYRASDADRGEAISALGAHFSDGRLSLVEYEDRVAEASAATNRRELDSLFTDLPPLDARRELVPYYSAREIESAHRAGARPKAGIMALTSAGAVGLAITSSVVIEGFGLLFLLLIPTAYALLYMLKVGPDTWHQPSQRELDKQRLQQLRMERRFEQEERKALRRAKANQLTDSALSLASEAMRKRLR